MKTEFDYFLLIADEMNISRAAKRAFVSQQCLSKYLKQLEDKIGAPLFVRSPRFELTHAGQLVLQHARQIKALSQNMTTKLSELSKCHVGHMRFGIAFGRAMQLLPILFPPFHQRYPNMHLETVFGMTPELCSWATNGNLDFLIGLSIPENDYPLQTLLLAEEQLLLAISDNLLLRYFPDDFPDCKYRFSRGVDLHDFVSVPFLMNPPISRMHVALTQFCARENLTLSSVATINSNEIQLSLAAKDCAACFFPQFLAPYSNLLNNLNGQLHQLNIFPIKNLGAINKIFLAYRKDRHLSEYDHYFISLIRDSFKTYPISNFIGIEIPTSS